MMPKGMAKHWCFTINNYTDEDIKKLTEVECEYIIYGKEVGENGTPHLQGYVCFTNKKRLSKLKKEFHSTAHLEIKRGTVKEALTYCKKDGDFVERGETPKEQTAKADETRLKYQQIIAAARAGDLHYVEDQHPTVFLQYNRVLNSLFTCDDTIRPCTRGIWIYGPSGSGKTSGVLACLENGHYEKPPRTKWWDGYKGEKVST